MKRIELHFEHFVCDSDGGYCGSSGCLHEVWIFGRSHYHLSRSYYAPAGDAPAWLSGYGPSRQNALDAATSAMGGRPDIIENAPSGRD
jgi:hypothetical protein